MKTNPKESIPARRQAVYDEARAFILANIGIAEEQLYTYIFETGCAYLENLMAHDRVGYQVLAYSKIYWAWWRNQWHRRDEELMHTYLILFAAHKSRTIRLQYYIKSHMYISYMPGKEVFSQAKKEISCQPSKKA